MNCIIPTLLLLTSGIISSNGFLIQKLSNKNHHLLQSLSNDNNSNDGDDFMASLRNRIEEVTDNETKLPLVVLDSMLPRQGKFKELEIFHNCPT